MKIFISYSVNSSTYHDNAIRSGYSNCVIERKKKILSFEELMDIQKDIQENLKKLERFYHCQVVIISFQYLED